MHDIFLRSFQEKVRAKIKHVDTVFTVFCFS